MHKKNYNNHVSAIFSTKIFLLDLHAVLLYSCLVVLLFSILPPVLIFLLDPPTPSKTKPRSG